MVTLHITHNDLDGLGCGVLIKKFMPGTITTVYTGYDEVENIIEENIHMYDRIIITDVSASYGTIEMLAGEKDVIIIDHHATSSRLKEFPFTVHDITKCATLLTYEYLEEQGFNVSAYRDFAECVNDVDMWHLRREDSLRMGILFGTLGIERAEKRFLAEPYNGFTEAEDLIISLQEEQRDSYINKALKNVHVYKDVRGLRAGIVFAEAYSSELGNRIVCEDIADYAVLINAQMRKVSLRSHKDVDIRVIAEANGGGGHKNAAGFSIRQETFDIDAILSRVGIL